MSFKLKAEFIFLKYLNLKKLIYVYKLSSRFNLFIHQLGGIMFHQISKLQLGLSALSIAVLSTFSLQATASSHREAPFITQMPKVDGTDFYMFKSYEANKAEFVTLIANYVPGQNAYDGPNYYMLDPSAVYEIKIDNNGDAIEDLTYQFRFNNTNKDAKFAGVSIPLVVSGPGIANLDDANANVRESYTVSLVTTKPGTTTTTRVNAGTNSRIGFGIGRLAAAATTRLVTVTTPASQVSQSFTQVGTNSSTFLKPLDNIGNKTIPNYAAYAGQHIYAVNIPGCSTPGRVFVGQRKESFVVNLGEVFDLINLNPLGAVTGEKSDLEDKNVTSIAMEVPTACLTAGAEPVIGGWTTASLPQTRVLNDNPNDFSSSNSVGALTQVSRLGMPLVNEVVIGLKDKDKFNKSQPRNDVRDFGTYVVNPTLPRLIEALFGVPAPTFPRTDLVSAFATGIKGLNQPANVKPGEMVRLNTAIAATPLASQDPLGVLNLTDLAGFPNGRRPVDDVVDIELRVAEGILCTAGVKAATLAAGVDTGCGTNVAPDVNGSPFTDGARSANSEVSTEAFPYLLTPLAGSPNATSN